MAREQYGDMVTKYRETTVEALERLEETEPEATT